MRPRRPAGCRRAKTAPLDRLAETAQALSRQAVVDGWSVASSDVCGIEGALRDLGLGRPELAEVVPVVGRMILEVLMQDSATVMAIKPSVGPGGLVERERSFLDRSPVLSGAAASRTGEDTDA